MWFFLVFFLSKILPRLFLRLLTEEEEERVKNHLHKDVPTVNFTTVPVTTLIVIFVQSGKGRQDF